MKPSKMQDFTVQNNTPYRTMANYQKAEPERFKKPSLTVPNMALSIPEILIRYAQGQPINISSAANMTYSGEHFIPDLKTKDIIEQREIIAAHKEKTEKLLKSYNEKMQAREQRKQQEHTEKQLFHEFMQGKETDDITSFHEYLSKRKTQKIQQDAENKSKIEQAKPAPPQQ